MWSSYRTYTKIYIATIIWNTTTNTRILFSIMYDFESNFCREKSQFKFLPNKLSYFFSFPEKRMGCYKVKKMISWDMFVLLRYLYEEVITFYREIRIKIAQMLLFLICYFYLRNVDTNLHLLHYDYTPCIQMKVVINF